MSKCKSGYYYCYTDKKCKPISKGMRVTARFSGGGKEPEEVGIDKPLNGNGNENGNGNSNGGSNGGGVSEGTLHKWFKGSKSKDGKGGWVNVVTGGTCASDEPGEGTPKCVSSAKRASMSKAERLSAARRKKAADPGQQQKTGAAKPTYVSTDKKKMKKEEAIIETKDKKGKGSGKKDACYHKVKSRYSVWPSAYASGALVKCRKVGAANWGNKTESKDHEYSMARSQLSTIINAARRLKEKMKGEGNIEAWVQSKLTKAADYIDTAADYVDSGEMNEAKKCWPGYEKKGTKKMFGKTYNNCVKKEEVESKIGSGNLKKLSGKAVKRVDADVDGDVDTKDMKSKEMGEYIPSPTGKKLKPKVRFEEFSDWRAELDEDWQKVNKKDKTDGMSSAAVKAYRRENPGSKLKTAVTGDPKPGSKDAKRRKSFCARSKGQQDMHNIDCSKTPDKAICKARRRWKC
jgi:hypothetical protein